MISLFDNLVIFNAIVPALEQITLIEITINNNNIKIMNKNNNNNNKYILLDIIFTNPQFSSFILELQFINIDTLQLINSKSLRTHPLKIFKLFCNQIIQTIQKNIITVPFNSQIMSKVLLNTSSNSLFLTLNKTIHHNRYSHIHILILNNLS